MVQSMKKESREKRRWETKRWTTRLNLHLSKKRGKLPLVKNSQRYSNYIHNNKRYKKQRRGQTSGDQMWKKDNREKGDGNENSSADREGSHSPFCTITGVCMTTYDHSCLIHPLHLLQLIMRQTFPSDHIKPSLPLPSHLGAILFGIHMMAHSFSSQYIYDM